MFDEIYEAARRLDTKALDALRQQGVCLTQYKPGDYGCNAATELAKENNTEAVELLRKRYWFSPDSIAYGYAIGGHRAEVELYRSRHKASVHKIAQGYALGGYNAEVELYRSQYNAAPSLIAGSYAKAGHRAEVELYRSQHNALVACIAIGYAERGHSSDVEIYRSQHGVSVDTIAQAYALGGHSTEVELYRTRHDADVGFIAQGYAHGGHIKEAETYLMQFTDVCEYWLARFFKDAGQYNDDELSLMRFLSSFHRLGPEKFKTFGSQCISCLISKPANPDNFLEQALILRDYQAAHKFTFAEAQAYLKRGESWSWVLLRSIARWRHSLPENDRIDICASLMTGLPLVSASSVMEAVPKVIADEYQPPKFVP